MKQRILVVDDDSDVRKAHARYVQALGYDAETAADGVEALTKLALEIDLVLLDLHMPQVDGFEVTKTIRADPHFRLIPIIVVTGSERTAWYPRALEVGANAVLSKPLNLDELHLNTRWLLEMKSAQDALSKSNAHLKRSVEEATQSLRAALESAVQAERRVQIAHLDTIRRLTIAAEFKDETLSGHLARVGQCAGVLAARAGLPTHVIEIIRHAAPLHDVGMIGIPDAVLLKKGPLDEVELTLVREHTRIGASLLANSESEVLQMGANIALHHHEHWDGGGYPTGLAGDSIPIEARICALVDYCDASTMHRPYRRARPSKEVVAEMVIESGARFDPKLMDAFVAALPEMRVIREAYPMDEVAAQEAKRL